VRGNQEVFWGRRGPEDWIAPKAIKGAIGSLLLKSAMIWSVWGWFFPPGQNTSLAAHAGSVPELCLDSVDGGVTSPTHPGSSRQAPKRLCWDECREK